MYPNMCGVRTAVIGTVNIMGTTSDNRRIDAGDPPARRLDRDSFAQLYRDAYAGFRVVAAVEAGADHADDVVQQAAVVALERLDRFRPGTSFRAWMCAIIRGVARNHRRGEHRRRRRHRMVADRSHPEEVRDQAVRVTIPSDDATPEVEFHAAFDEDLRNALDRLGPQQRACMVLKSVLGYSYREIGAMLDLPEATARSHVFRARRRLLTLLDPEGRRGGDDAR